MGDQLKVFSGSAHPGLAQEICNLLETDLGKLAIHKFANDNIKVKIEENVRNADVFVIQPSTIPVNEGLMELLIIIDAIKHASANRITAVVPYYPYARSDKKDEPRISITARLVADLLETAGANRILTMDLHSPQIQGFCRIPADQLLALPILCDYFGAKLKDDYVVVSADAGGVKMTTGYAARLHLPLAIIDKRRFADDDRAAVLNIVGDVKGKKAIIFDDEVSTAGTLTEAAEHLLSFGATEVAAGIVHPVLVGKAITRIAKSKLSELVVTNTLPVPPEKKLDKMTVLSVAPLFAEAIKRIHDGESVSALFR
ncbi:MAG: ribose-phosphate pyrophosphokinase [Candidatus Abyssobacteria bacterium SURF_17]|jgi:ribose-phosphate pyrophosphokinase|uniref:Ribose-phosphate pyrophosphokinase n=1 Tax=Candidatus Abyssobacteria bacterium SURF_17 TaxID=2093361 RepID=A0A419F2P9_9BACT|nr:MAG: ribose-phosphate pyrophosphokinase [Candidatus Abyssubacteria bacterium SURF_17]